VSCSIIIEKAAGRQQLLDLGSSAPKEVGETCNGLLLPLFAHPTIPASKTSRTTLEIVGIERLKGIYCLPFIGQGGVAHPTIPASKTSRTTPGYLGNSLMKGGVCGK
jgi:hypothetical protein